MESLWKIKMFRANFQEENQDTDQRTKRDYRSRILRKPRVQISPRMEQTRGTDHHIRVDLYPCFAVSAKNQNRTTDQGFEENQRQRSLI